MYIIMPDIVWRMLDTCACMRDLLRHPRAA